MCSKLTRFLKVFALISDRGSKYITICDASWVCYSVIIPARVYNMIILYYTSMRISHTYLLNGTGDTFIHACVVGSYIIQTLYIYYIHVYSQPKRILLINPPRASLHFTVNIDSSDGGGAGGWRALGKVISQHGFLFTPPHTPCVVALFTPMLVVI